jgi:hypothetical protein
LEQLLRPNTTDVGVFICVGWGRDVAVIASLDPLNYQADDDENEEAAKGAKHGDEDYEDEAVTMA